MLTQWMTHPPNVTVSQTVKGPRGKRNKLPSEMNRKETSRRNVK